MSKKYTRLPSSTAASDFQKFRKLVGVYDGVLLLFAPPRASA